MAARSKARKRALDVLFEADQRGENILNVLDERIASSGREAPLPEYAIEIVRGVVAHIYEIDDLLSDSSTEWTLERMPAVDRAVLHIGAWEILFNSEVPSAVAIDEAINLAADLSTDDSARFVHGVLAGIVRESGQGQD